MRDRVHGASRRMFHGSEDNRKPAWIDGVSADYPSAQYLTGVGQGDNRAVAEDRAYAAVARIFKAEVSAQSKDWESYLVVEQRGSSRDERRLTLDNLTRVSTDKVLENVENSSTVGTMRKKGSIMPWRACIGPRRKQRSWSG